MVIEKERDNLTTNISTRQEKLVFSTGLEVVIVVSNDINSQSHTFYHKTVLRLLKTKTVSGSG